MDFNVTVPVGTVNHGVGNLICPPAKWYHYVIFFLTNYVAHAASLPASPGECWQETIVNVATALFVPGYGVLRALRGLYLHARLSKKDELDCAARSGALAMIVRSRMLSGPHDERHWSREKYRAEAIRVPWQRAVFGRCDIGPKYRDRYSLVTVPHDFPLTEKLPVGTVNRTAPRTAESIRGIRLAYTYNVPKLLVAAFQAVWGSITLYKARGDQLERYGYAAFGLSVAPYVFMSLVNIATSLVTPDYPVMYLVHTPDMEEVIEAGAIIEGLVASVDMEAIRRTDPIRLCNDLHTEPTKRWLRLLLQIIHTVFTLLMIWGPFIVVACISRFKPGQSTVSERAWLLSWLVVGTGLSMFVLLCMSPDEHADRPFSAVRFRRISLIVPFFIPAVGGMVTVAGMLREYGVCTRFAT